MELTKIATLERSKLNNTSFKNHSMYSNLMGPMSVWATQFITKTESDHQFERIDKDIASCMDHTEQLLHSLYNAIEALEKGTTLLQQEVQALKAMVQCIHSMHSSGVAVGELRKYQKEQDAKIKHQQMEIRTLHHELQEQTAMMRTVYATKFECESHRQQLRELQKFGRRETSTNVIRRCRDIATQTASPRYQDKGGKSRD